MRQPLVKSVLSGTGDASRHELAAKQQKGFGAMLSFDINGDEAAISAFYLTCLSLH